MRLQINVTNALLAAGLTLVFFASPGCDRDSERRETDTGPVADAVEPVQAAPKDGAPPPKTPEPAAADPSEPTCPAGMVLLPGGPFWVGAEHESFAGEENPRFLTRLAPFCLDPTEATAASYRECVEAGACQPARKEYKTCNYGREGRADHPINCIDHGQATSYCEWRGARLPSEIEWEYAARGGAEQRSYPWGEESPDGRNCWKKPHSCAVKSFAPGAFGLYDVVGNVWEWTEDWFAPYPWPAQNGRHRVYRGASWSRRFEKWLRPTLRNRFAPDHWGSHLGVRCAAFAEPLQCPYGVDDAGDGAGKSPRCRRGVEEAQCLGGKRWNGVRCADEGAPRCPGGTEEVPGWGCVGSRSDSGPDSGAGSGAEAAKSGQGASGKPELDTAAVRRVRSPEFDADCQQNTPSRPRAHRLEGGTHVARNAVGAKHGCKNRDVGVGWNSACCP